ncbi:TRAP transporter solute receptor, TAXI family [Thermaerobacter marianensis DSM 12885]|uniref:TRAP transporter solute receptor, TAXI family n=1 Tax=Thermaerobacter marianensis (strain ATCC 700841 / DSM 12885 / JCM 10246 / 7p75a) TaxID=644966 RepID=E6SJV1_THEM7|nr:TAXI family TRAP transporter solute-binding subunit [Thermaerobacter marianensis]ADU52184.1 TRAP transporter solute receptor, TAXI family [Thermaerobacter marianensis DSM 12885]
MRWRKAVRRGIPALVVVLALGVLAGCGGASGPSPAGGSGGGGGAQGGQIRIATGGTGGVYYIYGGAIAEVLTRHLEGVNAVAEVTSASVDNILLLASGQAELAFSLADTAYLAAQGQDPFDGPQPVRALAVLYNNYNHLVTRADSGIRTLADLKGKRVSTGAPGSGTEVTALRILEAAGLDPETDVKREFLGVQESADALRDGRIDAFFWSGGYPTGAISDLANTPGLDIYLVPMGEVVDTLVQKYGAVYVEDVFPAGAYSGDVKQDTPTVAVPNYLLVPASMDEQRAYDILKTLFDYKDELVAVHPEAEKLTLENAVTGQVVEYHPGAIRYYQEQGAWNR